MISKFIHSPVHFAGYRKTERHETTEYDSSVWYQAPGDTTPQLYEFFNDEEGQHLDEFQALKIIASQPQPEADYQKTPDKLKAFLKRVIG